MGGFKGVEIEYKGETMTVRQAVGQFLIDFDLHFNEDGAYSQLMSKGKQLGKDYQQAFDEWSEKMKRKFNR